MLVSWRADEGAYNSIISGVDAEKAVVDGVGKHPENPSVTMQVALKDEDDAKQFKISQIWSVPRTILKLFADPLPLLNLECLVSNSDLAVKDFLLGLPVIRHLEVDTKTLLEERKDLLDGSNRSIISILMKSKQISHVSYLMIARFSDVVIENLRMTGKILDEITEFPRRKETSASYFQVHKEEEPFPNLSVVGLLDGD